jgi:hypothetical protein
MEDVVRVSLVEGASWKAGLCETIWNQAGWAPGRVRPLRAARGVGAAPRATRLLRSLRANSSMRTTGMPTSTARPHATRRPGRCARFVLSTPIWDSARGRALGQIPPNFLQISRGFWPQVPGGPTRAQAQASLHRKPHRRRASFFSGSRHGAQRARVEVRRFDNTSIVDQGECGARARRRRGLNRGGQRGPAAGSWRGQPASIAFQQPRRTSPCNQTPHNPGNTPIISIRPGRVNR